MYEKILGCFVMEIIAHYYREHITYVRGEFIHESSKKFPSHPLPKNRKRDMYSSYTIRFVKMSASCHLSCKRSAVSWSTGLLFSLSRYLVLERAAWQILCNSKLRSFPTLDPQHCTLFLFTSAWVWDGDP